MAEPTKTNVIFILTDDQGPWAAGCCGNPEIRTPNIDKLAAGGLRFENFFSVAPVCSPARASLLTGRIPSQHGVHDWVRRGKGQMPPDPTRFLDGLTCYTDVLAANGYTCGLAGKWHLGGSMSPQHGLSHWFVLAEGGYNDPQMARDGEGDVCPGYLTDLLTDDVLAFIEQNRDRPFYMSLHHLAPHTPWTGQHRWP